MTIADVIREQPTPVTAATAVTLNFVALITKLPADVVAGGNAMIGAWLLVLHLALLPKVRVAQAELVHQAGYDAAVADVAALVKPTRARKAPASG